MQVLLIEDDVDLAATIGEYLEAKGHDVEFAYDGRTGLDLAKTRSPEVLILDIQLPGINGLEVCRSLRKAKGELPVLMLTARETLEDKLAGFDAGADDYLLKPFEMAELVARLEALHRRAYVAVADEVLNVGDLTIEPATGRITRDGRALALHRIGVELLTLLARESPRIVSREHLEAAIWGAHPPDRDLLRSHLYLVRQVVDRPFEVALIRTVRGRGVRLAAPEAP